MRILEVTNKLVIDHRARDWCKLPYPGHPNGCPNYGKRGSCPPQAPFIEYWLGDYEKLWLVCVEFNLAAHIDNMLFRHPHWTNRQAKCVLYWQPRMNAKLKEAIYQFIKRPSKEVTYCPEAMGVNVIDTARKAGLPIETRPQKTVYKIALVVKQTVTEHSKG